jgi:hypothetical protein
MAFEFKKPVDPKKPQDSDDPPPNGWEYVDAKDHGKALFGFLPRLFTECMEWEERELARIHAVSPNLLY